MNSEGNPRRIAGRITPPNQGGPPLGVLAVVATILFVGGVIASTAMSGGHPFPSPFGSAPHILAYFRDHGDAVRVSAFTQFAAAVPLAIYAATASSRLVRLGIRAPGATIALVGGVIAAALLALSGLITWVLSRPEVTGEATVRSLHDLAFAAGGVGHVVFLGLLLAGIAVPALFAALLPRWFAWIGLIIAITAEFSTLAMLVDAASILLPIARFTALAWLIAAGFLLPRTRSTRSGTADPSSMARLSGAAADSAHRGGR
jgi:hypothetical protein